jgi:hypothetical protein
MAQRGDEVKNMIAETAAFESGLVARDELVEPPTTASFFRACARLRIGKVPEATETKIDSAGAFVACRTSPAREFASLPVARQTSPEFRGSSGCG